MNYCRLYCTSSEVFHAPNSTKFLEGPDYPPLQKVPHGIDSGLHVSGQIVDNVVEYRSTNSSSPSMIRQSNNQNSWHLRRFARDLKRWAIDTNHACHYKQQKQRYEANVRERRRMQSINKAFEVLRHRVPTLPYEKRISKVDTLRLATGYIGFLRELLASTDFRQQNKSGMADLGQRSTASSPNVVEIEKIILRPRYFDLRYDEEMFGLEEIKGHSLSWKFDGQAVEKGSKCNYSRKIIRAKIWTPKK